MDGPAERREDRGERAGAEDDVAIEEEPREAAVDLTLGEVDRVGLARCLGFDDGDRVSERAGDLGGAVGAGVGHDDDAEAVDAIGQHGPDALADQGFLVVGWDDDAGHRGSFRR